VLGSALEREAARNRAAGSEAVAPALDPGRYPHIAGAFRALAERPGGLSGPGGSALAEDALFEHGLRRLLDGLRIDQAARTTTGAAAADLRRVAGAGPPDLERIPGAGPPADERVGGDDPGGVRGGRSG
jgi:hypothetical protein